MNNLNDELIVAREILKHARNKKSKNSKDYEAIVDLTYFISVNKETIASKEIREKIQSGYYDEVYKIKIDKVTADNNCNLKLSEDNMQYSFF